MSDWKFLRQLAPALLGAPWIKAGLAGAFLLATSATAQVNLYGKTGTLANDRLRRLRPPGG